MIPLRDDVPSRTVPFVTYGLILLNVLVFVYEVRLGRRLEPFLDVYGLVPVRFHDPRSPVVDRFLPVAFSMFLHGGVLHLVGNMLYLHIFGDNVEDRLGHGRFLLFYLACGCVAALVQVAMFPRSSLPMVGASGAIAGVTGAYFVFYRHAHILTLVPIFFFVQLVRIPAVFFLFLWFVMQLVYGAASIGMHGADVGGVAWWAHIGGFAFGALASPLLARRGPRRAAFDWVH